MLSSWRRLKDPNLQHNLKLRAKILALVREFFVKEGFLETETPVLVPAAGQEPHLNPVKTEICDDTGRSRTAYFITSPEYSQKKLLAAGFEKTFEITKCVRVGEPWSGSHNPEFTMIEWYRARSSYLEIMKDVEQLVYFVAVNLASDERANLKSKIEKLEISYQGREIDLTLPWERLTMCQAWRKWAGIDLEKNFDREAMAKICLGRGYTVEANDTLDDLFYKIFLTEIEPKLGFPKPTILCEYPASMAALSRLKKDDQRWAERFEVYVAGLELGNAFSELCDSGEQRKRFLEEQNLRRSLGKEIIPLDEDFLEAVGKMPQPAGIAFGIDRLVMLLADTPNISDVIAFPAGGLFK